VRIKNKVHEIVNKWLKNMIAKHPDDGRYPNILASNFLLIPILSSKCVCIYREREKQKT